MLAASCRPTAKALLLAVATAIVTGCAETPPTPAPVPTSDPQVGDTVEQIASRGYAINLIYTLAADGREYTYLYAKAKPSDYPLILIDGVVACDATNVYANYEHRQAMEQWQWASEPGGLPYLASQMRQACRLEADGEVRTLEHPWQKPMPKVAEDESIGEMFLHIVIGVPVAIMAAPYVLAGGAAAAIVGSPWIIAESRANARQLEGRKQVRLGSQAADVEQILGKPKTSFQLEAARTTVLMYEAGGKDMNYFIGLQDGAIVWIHAQDEWLEHMAKHADRKQKSAN